MRPCPNAYFDRFISFSVHLRIREQNHADTRTLYPPRSGFTYWQVESEKTIVDGRSAEGVTAVKVSARLMSSFRCNDES